MMNQSPAPKPTKLRQAIDRAIARVQAEAAAEQTPAEQRALPAPPKPLSGAELTHASVKIPEEQAQPEQDTHPSHESAVVLEHVSISEAAAPEYDELSSVAESELSRVVAEEAPEALWPIPPQESQPEPVMFQRDQRYQQAAEQATQRDRSAFPRVERVLTPMSAAELGWQRPQLRRPLRQPEPAQPQLEVPEQLETELTEAPVADEPLEPEQAVQPAPVQASTPVVETPSRKPLTPEVLAALSPDVAPPPELRRPPTQFAILAGLLWAVVLGWLLFGGLGPHSSQTTRWLFGATTLVLGICTWGPIQWGLRLQSLTWRGTVGWMIVFWWLAFVRPPTSSLTSLPDTPLYILLCVGVFMALSTVVMPILYFRRVQRSGSRRERFDIRRTQRQANEVALFVALCIILAAMNVLELVSVILLIMILALSEMLLLSIQRT